MKWNNVNEKNPKDDQDVLVANIYTPDMIHRAYYEIETGLFFSLESSHAFPLHVTHWTEMVNRINEEEL